MAPRAMRLPAQDQALIGLDSLDVDLNIDAPEGEASIDPKTGAATIELDDGGVLIDFNPAPAVNDNGPSGFDENLAEKLPPAELARISDELLRGVQLDDQSRKEWLETRAQGIRLLGLKIEQPRGSMDASVALEGMSTVRHQLLLEAVMRFQANARGELLPSSGPVKVSDKTDETGQIDTQAEALEDDLNYYLTTVATEYYPDTDRALFATGFGGCSFKKVYNCPIRNRPVSESVDAKDLIVSDSATDLRNCARVTHQIMMRPSVLKRMQLAGAYRDIQIPTASSVDINPVEQEIADVQGIDISAQQQAEDNREHTIYEVYCELNLAGYEHKQDGQVTGLPLPYRVVIEKDSQVVLEVRRNWEEDDERQLAKICFVKYPYVPGMGFYDIGLIHILGNLTNALTAAQREMLDAGMFANFPGFLIAKGASRQNSNEMRVPPGGAVQVETNGNPISEAVMALPYKDPSTAFAQFIEHLEETGQRLGGTAETNIGEGVQNAPVGTTLALIEQATKVEGAVHKRLHAAQSEEFQLLKQCFRENPESFVRALKAKGNVTWNVESFLAALENVAIVPMADPNTPSHTHRLMKAMGVKQLAGANPALYNMRAVDEYVMQQAGVPDPDRFFAVQTGAPAAPDPKLIELAAKAKQDQSKQQAQEQDNAVKLELQAHESADQAAERASREKLGEMHLAEAVIDHDAKAKDAAADAAEAQNGGNSNGGEGNPN
jgi:hypothetical protein